jgi:nicotinate-nucleotide adenylyltransferase
VGLIGGTFDPIHLGHLIIAEETRTQLALDGMVFAPAGDQPLKPERQITDPEHRLRMVELAIAGNPYFSASRVDVDRPGPHYTVETVQMLREAWVETVEIYFLIGSDSLADLPKWHQPERLMRLCHIVAVGRPGYQVDLEQLERSLPGVTSLIQRLDTPTLDISATEIRRRVRERRSIRYLVPASVRRYIEEHRLYRTIPSSEHNSV